MLVIIVLDSATFISTNREPQVKNSKTHKMRGLFIFISLSFLTMMWVWKTLETNRVFFVSFWCFKVFVDVISKQQNEIFNTAINSACKLKGILDRFIGSGYKCYNNLLETIQRNR